MTVLAVAQTPTLADLANTANCEHEAVVAAGREAIAHAIRAGEALLAAREFFPHGEWQPWLTGNFAGSIAVASAYMRIARYRDVISGCETFTQARLYLRGLPAVSNGAPPSLPDDLREQAVALIGGGASVTEAAEMLHVSRNSVKRWTDPGYAHRSREASRQAERERYRRRREEREQARAAKIKRAARKAGGSIAEAYAMAEKMQDVLGQAHAEATDREAREALGKAGQHYRKMRDEIVRALGVS